MRLQAVIIAIAPLGRLDIFRGGGVRLTLVKDGDHRPARDCDMALAKFVR
jgi:hypothetical protein